ncbi:HAUS augmin-like complex subunit 6 isoform X2 [Physeter macrocephalus]|uniref:HAUS augmin-like complex subunit 6 isoform X2 n=1 Tax=Physeter macrocephalus TaxID=9755 RepID=A0A2Y9SWP9_PHYMC|nr:HAUS augmin-like complex subunit 6 isoform X2 [Physeter catodon]|eukprot:XP_023982598.1 HAUS augmin-like complex subunit 6 isoform X2 [Physeter catodon]
MSSVPSFEKEHLWMYLRALGFEPGSATVAGGKIVSHTHLGVNMFDKLNRDAFHIVSYFLFQTLDQSLTKEVFKLCWPPFDQKSDTEFRKHCCEWLKKISAECGSSFPQVVGSLFLSPGGPKFIHLMYHFARFVAINYIKTHSKNSSVHFTETFNVKPQDLHKCMARCHVARNRFLQILQREDCVTRKYQENAQLSVKQIENLRSECIGQQNQIKKMEPYDDQSNIQEKIQKVRSLWASVNETLMVLEKEREVVSSVLNVVNQYTLDGTNVAINIPRLLLDKIEKQMCQLHIGNVYEAGKLNLLTVIQLLNEVLKVMKYEHCQANQARLTIDLHFLEKETKVQRERLSDLKHMRYKIKADLTTIRHSIVEKQEEWHKNWKEFLGLSPFSLIKGWTPAVDLLPPMSPLSFDPASEEAYAKSILLQYPASLPDTHKQHIQENDCRRASDILETKCDLANSPASFLLQPVSPSDRNSVTLLEKDTKLTTPREKNETVSKKTPEFEVEDSSSSNIAKSSALGGSLPAEKSDPFQKEQDHLVEEVARAVLSDSPQPSKGKEVILEELIDSLVSNPFLTRNQIPRTPENLISEIRSSWRKAVKIEDNRSTEPIQMDTEHREVLPESLPMVHNQKELNMDSFFSATTVSNSSHSHLPEEKVVSDCLKCVLKKPVVTSCIGEPTTQNLSDLLNKDIICKQDLECTALQNKFLETSQIETFSPAIGNRRDVIGSSEEEYIKISDYSKPSYTDLSMHKSMLWNSFQISSGISSNFKDSDFGILHETLPEEVGHLSLNSSSSTEANFKLEPNSPMHSSIIPEGAVGGRQNTPKSDFNLQATCSGYEALKKSLPKQREEICLSNPETLERHKPELSLTSQYMQTDDMLNFSGTQDSHIDYTKPSSRMSLGEGKQSLSPLIKFSPVEQRLRTTIPCSLGELLPNLTVNFAEDILNKSLDSKESPSDLKDEAVAQST